MQAHHRPEREDPEEGRQNPAPPAGAEPCGVLVTEHLAYLPLEHGSLVHFVALSRKYLNSSRNAR